MYQPRTTFRQRRLGTADGQTVPDTLLCPNLTSQSNAAVDCLFGFTGRAYDENCGLQNDLNRWYDSKVGRWVSKDPIGFLGQDANLYRYVGNGVTNVTDPSGLTDTTGAISKYWKTITVFLGHHNDVVAAAKAAANDIAKYRIQPAKIAGIACGGGAKDINIDLRSYSELSRLVPNKLQELPTAVGRSDTFVGPAGSACPLPDVDTSLLTYAHRAGWEAYKAGLKPEWHRAAQSEAVNRAFVNSLIEEAINMLPACHGMVKIHIVQLPEGWWPVYTTQDLAKEVGIGDGYGEIYKGHSVLWQWSGKDIIGTVR